MLRLAEKKAQLLAGLILSYGPKIEHVSAMRDKADNKGL